VYRLRSLLRRFPVGYWLAAFLLVGFTFVVVTSFVGRASAAAARWGTLRPVAVAARPVTAGAVIGPADVVVRDLPASVVPASALRRAPVGRAALAPLARDEVVTAGRLAPEGVSGVAALLPAGARALAVPVGPGTPPLRRGDRVDVLVTLDGEPTFAVAAAAEVLALATDKAVTLAVTPDEAPRVAFALAQGTVTLALVGVR
jgi:Flp pilus assembly protein CpaB